VAGEPKVNPTAGKSEPTSEVPGKRKTAYIVLGIMLSMAIIGLGYMLWTVKLRQSRHPKPALDPITFTQPLDLKGLGHLPKDCDIIVGLHIAEWLDDKKVGKPLLDEPRPAALEWIVKQLPRMTGLKLEEIDHAVLAVSLDAQFPQVQVVIKTRRAYDLAKIAEHARAAEPPQYQDRPLYHLELNPGDALLWCVDDKTLLGVIRFDVPKREHLAGLSMTPRPVGDVLPVSLHEAMKERLPKREFVWAVGKLERLDAIKDLLAFVPGGKVKLNAIKGLQTFAVGLEPVEGLTLTGNFHLADAKTAAGFKTMLEGIKIEGVKSQKVEATPPEAPQQWVTWQVRGDVPALREWLNLGKDLKK
jgi:hypothetical protein